MRCRRFLRVCSRIVPNVIVLLFAGWLFVASNFILIPQLISTSHFPLLWRFSWLSVLASFVMWLWCWITVITGDPGSVKHDLRRRGLLRRVIQGDIPSCIRHRSLCAVCHLPRPPQSMHCYTCGSCFLHYDHHCR
jgi:hypothetical protein